MVRLNERRLCREPLTKFHLTVSERHALPEGSARFNVLVEVVAEALRDGG